ncbi:MAG TPA: GGDEF domain-containing protein [Acidobacteriaceae bacterium]|nr:GGDEF domain-containing protein [Acidobacteriaceae bacterium]
MYMPLLMYGYAVALVLMLLGCRLAMRTVPGLAGLPSLSFAIALGLVSVIGFSVRPWAPAWITIMIANLALFAAMLLLYCAAADTVAARRKFLPSGIALWLASGAGFAWFTWIHPALTPRILMSSSLCAVYAGAAAWVLYRHRGVAGQGTSATMLRSLISSMVWLESAVVALHTVRCVLTVCFPPSSFIHLDSIQAGFSYLNLVLVLGNICGLIWLSLCRHRAELQVLAQTDGLTGLLNRRAFEQILARELARAQRGGDSLAVLLVDIDRFKEVNDTLGHLAGDEVIRRVSAVLRGGLRPADALGRYGGEEFVCMLRESSPDQAEEVAERLRVEIAGLSAMPGGLRITASIGVAASQPTEDIEQLLRRCDDALYGSKRRGRNLVTIHRAFPASSDVSIQPA